MAHAVIMPKAGMSMETGTILRWLRNPGDTVRRGEPLLEIETDKVAMEVEAEQDGVLLAVTRLPGEEVAVTEVIGYIGSLGEVVPLAPGPTPSASEADQHLQPRPAGPASTAAPQSGGPVRASPLARSIARQRGLSLGAIRGSGPGGAVRVRDLPPEGGGATAHEVSAGTERRPLTRFRRGIGASMARSHRDIPSVTLHADADVTELERIRNRWNSEHEARLSLTPFLLRAAALGCRAHPLLRSSLDGEDLLTHTEVNLGMAVALEGGLIVPVLRGADRMAITLLAERARELAEKAREGKLTPSHLSGAVFTVTNLGMYGVTSFDPPQSAILGVGAVRDQLALRDGQVEARRRLDLALSFDHRILDGAEGTMALGTIREALESPLELLL